jgi:hypothetical protein
MDAPSAAEAPRTPVAPRTPRAPSTTPRANAAANDQELAAELRAFKTEQKMSTHGLGAAFGVEHSTISRWTTHGVPRARADHVRTVLAGLRTAVAPSADKENDPLSIALGQLKIEGERKDLALPVLTRLALSLQPVAGFVYVHTGPAPETYKIGRTDDILERVRNAKASGVYPDFKLLAALPTHDAVALERIVHDALSDYRVQHSATGRDTEVFSAPLAVIIENLTLYQVAVSRLV